MVIQSPYLPNIIKEAVANVNTTFSTRLKDPFNVFFDYGLYVDVQKSVYKKDNNGDGTYPLIWLVTSSIEIIRSANTSFYGTATFDVIIAMPTENDYTQQDRTENTFLPRLYPIYDEFISELGKSEGFRHTAKGIEHRYHDRPYWGGSESGSSDQPNLFKNFIDAIQVRGIKMELKKGSTRCIPRI